MKWHGANEGLLAYFLSGEKLSGYSANEDRSPFADVCASLIELMVFDRFLVGHPLGFQRCDDAVVVVCDDRFAAERLADSDDAVIEAVHQHEVRVDFGQFVAKDGTQILELIIEREDGDRLLQIGEVEELK